MVSEALAAHPHPLRASLLPRSSSGDRVISSECTTAQQGIASSPAHACQQHWISHQLVDLLSAGHTPMLGSMPCLHLSLHLDLHSFYLQPSQATTFQSYKHRICQI
ncbi:Os01g0116250 [Oryza sativa Japonica Group]|uniref:Os01g0116250 protein n=1 Tax=Oryza sativa subsp. japonica TaxID=39947 RepID=A0A0P0UX90_ORYSJ|nr:Os01g0116250 [Oryza sativa Japonica Group]